MYRYDAELLQQLAEARQKLSLAAPEAPRAEKRRREAADKASTAEVGLYKLNPVYHSLQVPGFNH